MKKKISYSTFFYWAIIFCLILITLKTISHVNEYKSEIKQLENVIKEEKEIDSIKSLTEEFIEKSSVGQHGELLTGSAREEYEIALKNEGLEEHEHLEEEGHLEKYDLINTFSESIDEKTARSYAIYKAYYGNNPNSNSITTQRVLFLSLTADWMKTEDGFKVYNYKIDLLQDSLDEQLKEMSETIEE